MDDVILWYWVMAVSSPWVAAKYSLGRKVESFDDAVLSECLKGIL